MATIKPFHALHPNPFYADGLVFPGEEQVFYFGIGEKENPLLPLKSQLETPARIHPETAESQEQAYREIRRSLDCLLTLDRLRKDEKAGFYVYEIIHGNYRQTGVWALTSVRDFFNGHIRLHEQTLSEGERRIFNYRKNTGLEGSPVLLTYHADTGISRIIAQACAGSTKATIGNRKILHQLWKIEDKEIIDQLSEAFSGLTRVYMADGHHRLASAGTLSVETGTDAWISSLYVATDQLRILDYHRAIIPLAQVDERALMTWLDRFFTILPSDGNLPVKPTSAHVIGMCVRQSWVELHVKKPTVPDVVLLQEEILAGYFGITDPRDDIRLKCIGGEKAMEEILSLLGDEPSAIGFTLYPMSIQQLVKAMDAGYVLPPKSTWIDPKVPYGLLMCDHYQQV